MIASDALAPPEHARLVRRAIFELDKWDPQVGDVAVLAPFALVLSPAELAALVAESEAIGAELATIEAALEGRGDLDGELGLDLPLRLALRGRRAPPVLARVMRLDFHLTARGFALSEVNADVPGGYNEASGVTALFAEVLGLAPTGDPAGVLASAIAARLPAGANVAMVHATAWADDAQVMTYLGKRFAERGLVPHRVAPDGLSLERNRARIGDVAIDAVVRFFPAEWLPRLALGCRWWRFFGGTSVPMTNPAAVVRLQSKRWPLVVDRLGVGMPRTRLALGAHEAPTRAHLDPSPRGRWVLKPALGRVGDGVGVPGTTSLAEWADIARAIRARPREWVAQERFVATPLETPDGPMHACLGVYLVDGRFAGIYGRIAPHARIDGRARDVAVLVRRDSVAP